MASITLSIQLPSHSYSFTVSISSTATIAELKQLVSVSCPGAPRPEGQRLIWKGRQLQDSQVVGDVWNTGEPIYNIHLVVYQSAWTAAPPEGAHPLSMAVAPSTPSPAAASPAIPLPSPHTSQLPSFAGPQQPHGLSYIQFLHVNALRMLVGLPAYLYAGPEGQPMARAQAKSAVERSGRQWAPILDAHYPAVGPDEGPMVQYAIVQDQHLPYLVLQTPERTPTLQQKHAVSVLTFTFPLLNPAPLVRAQMIQEIQQAIGGTALAPNQLPLRPLAAMGGAALQQMPQIHVRALVAPVLMLMFRAGVMLYFFSPTKRPMLALIVTVWAAWELWNAFQAAIDGGRREQAAQNVVAAPNAAGAAAAAPLPGQPGVVAAPRLPARSTQDMITQLAGYNIASEAAALVPGTPPVPPPSGFSRAKSFVVLFFLSMHPAVWSGRRRLLRARETQLRQAYPETVDEDSGAVVPQLPVGWVGNYIERVRQTEWVDE